MASENPLNDSESNLKHKKRRPGFKIGPDNLPDGTYRRKVVKIKKDLIQKAKIKKSYAKLKAREHISTVPTLASTLQDQPTLLVSQELHPERQAMLKAPEEISSHPKEEQFSHKRHRSKKPRYYEKEQAFAEKKKEEREAQKLKYERQAMERAQKLEERERFRKAMAKARSRGHNGQRKLGRESAVLLEKIKRNYEEPNKAKINLD